MLGFTWGEPIQEIIVHHVDEELGATRVCCSCVGHGKGARFIGVTRDIFIQDVASIETLFHSAGLQVLELAIWWTTSACIPGLWILGMGATKLCHEVWDDTMEVHAIVEARLRKVNEIGRSARNPVKEDLQLEFTHRGYASGNWIRHVEVTKWVCQSVCSLSNYWLKLLLSIQASQ
jgi:hypothetical protein